MAGDLQHRPLTNIYMCARARIILKITISKTIYIIVLY